MCVLLFQKYVCVYVFDGMKLECFKCRITTTKITTKATAMVGSILLTKLIVTYTNWPPAIPSRSSNISIEQTIITSWNEENDGCKVLLPRIVVELNNFAIQLKL